MLKKIETEQFIMQTYVNDRNAFLYLKEPQVINTINKRHGLLNDKKNH